MPDVKGTIEIGRPVEDVFTYLSDPSNVVKWESGVEVMELTSEGPIGVGSKGRRVETYMGRDESVWEVTEWKPNELVAMKYESDKFIGDGEYRTEAIDGGTRLSYRFGGKPKGMFFKLLAPVVMPLMMMKINGTARKNYQKLKEILESQS